MNESSETRYIRVLHVEDDERWRAIVEEALRAEGFRVSTVESCAEAERLFSESYYHLLVLDIAFDSGNASNIEGMQLLELLDQRGLGTTSVIFLSAYGTKDMLRKAFCDYRVAAFLDKYDFDPMAFINVVKKVFEQIRGKEEPERMRKEPVEP